MMQEEQYTLLKLQQILKRQRSTKTSFILLTILTLLSTIGLAVGFVYWMPAATTPIISRVVYLGCFVMTAILTIVFGRLAKKASAQVRLCRSTIREYDEHGSQVDTFALAYKTTTLADQHERSLLRRERIWLIPKLIFYFLFMISGFGMAFENALKISNGTNTGSDVGQLIFSFVWALVWGRGIYKIITKYIAQRKITKITKDAAQNLREQRQATVGAMSMAQASTSSGAMSLAHEHEGGLTDIQTLSNASSQDDVILNFDSHSDDNSNEPQTNVVEQGVQQNHSSQT